MINQVAYNILGIWTGYEKDTIPYTTGRLVADIFKKFIFKQFSANTKQTTVLGKQAAVMLELAKLALLDRGKKNYEENILLHNTVFSKDKKTLQEFFQQDNFEQTKTLLNKANVLYNNSIYKYIRRGFMFTHPVKHLHRTVWSK